MRKSDDGLRGIIRKNWPGCHWNSIETGAAEPGVPDLNGCINGFEFWIETKWTPAIAVDMRVEQIGWLLRRSRAGGHCFIAVRKHVEKGIRRNAADALYLFGGWQASDVARHGLMASPLLICRGPGPARWDWQAFRTVIQGPIDMRQIVQ